MATLNGIDVSSWQADLEPAKMTTTDFVVVKATGGASYSNPCFSRHASQVLAAGKLLGCYHYAREAGCKGTAKAEAAHFCEAVAPYAGRAVLALDWEEETSLGVAWAKAWLDEVRRLTGVRPLVYMSKSVANAYDWKHVARAGYELWVAQYPDYHQTDFRGESEIWTDGAGFGAWGTWRLFQYTSSGRVKGYGGNLDLDCFRGDRSNWLELAGASVRNAVKALLSWDKSDVKRAQKHYKALKAYSGKIDGDVGPLTRSARAKAMQMALNGLGTKLKVDGVCGELTRKAFSKYESQARKDAACVKAIQAAVITWGYDPGEIDGDYGRYTEQAVKAFQLARSLKPDCIVGPLTFTELFGGD